MVTVQPIGKAVSMGQWQAVEPIGRPVSFRQDKGGAIEGVRCATTREVTRLDVDPSSLIDDLMAKCFPRFGFPSDESDVRLEALVGLAGVS